MQPLDLRSAPPRSPRAELGGIIFLPRSIDKARASLPGGFLGDYAIDGFTQRMFDALEITSDAFTAAVAEAGDDAAVEAFVRAHTTPKLIDDWNAYARVREPAGGDRAKALERYPWLPERPDITLALDVLIEDDRRSFA